MSKQNKTFLVIAIILIAAIGLIYFRGKNNQGGGQALVKSINAADHLKGRLNAPIQVIVYSDFQCPFCVEFAETMKKVEQEFKDKVAIVFRHYPLSGHPEAEEAAEASECAAEQGKFWEMHDKLFADNAAGRLSTEQFKRDAVDLGLSQEQFNQCLVSGKYADKVSAQKAEGDQAGVTGTPTSFVNGNIYPGAYPFEDFIASDGRQEKGMKNIISELLK